MDAETQVFHLMGEPHETRHLVVADREAVLSPHWSIHAGAGTGGYSFVWAMAGDNQDFADMDALHSRAQASFAAKGTFDVTIDGVTVRAGVSASFVVAPHRGHGVLAIETTS